MANTIPPTGTTAVPPGAEAVVDVFADRDDVSTDGRMGGEPTLALGGRLAFASPEICLALFFVSFNSWLLYFLVNVAGLPALLAGAAFLLGRGFDAVMDPVVGRWSDRTRPEHGRLRLIRWGVAPACILFVGVWAAPVLFEATWAKFLAAAGAFMLFSFFYTLVAIPRVALLPDLVPDYDARTRQISLNMVFIFVSVLVAIALVPPLVTGVSGVAELARTPPSAWITVAALFGGVGFLAVLPFLFVVPDRRGGANVALPPLGAELRSLFQTPGYGLVVLIFLLSVLGTLMVQAMVPFYLESYLGIPGPQQGSILGGIFLLSILSFPFWGWVGTRIGKRGGLVAGIAVYAGFLLMVPFMPREGVTPIFVVACILSGIGISAINLFPWAMLPDSVDMDTATHGRAREGLVYAVFVFAQKTAGSIAVFWSSIMLWLFDHQAGQAVQGETTLTAFVWMTGPIPLAILVLAALVTLRYPITREAQAQARRTVRMREAHP